MTPSMGLGANAAISLLWCSFISPDTGCFIMLGITAAIAALSGVTGVIGFVVGFTSFVVGLGTGFFSTFFLS